MTAAVAVLLGILGIGLAVVMIKYARRKDRPWREWRTRYLYGIVLAMIVIQLAFGLVENLADVTNTGKTLVGVPLTVAGITALFILFTGLNAKAAAVRAKRERLSGSD